MAPVPPGPRLGDPVVVPSEEVGQHGVGVPARRRGTGGRRQLLADELQWRRKLACPQPLLPHPVEATVASGFPGDAFGEPTGPTGKLAASPKSIHTPARRGAM
ncbi:MAG TPA: hypothetical protein VFC03_19505 [Acidimicrobiales bacterium]|nr:hypothetical protein [Acidimicrobiales bacterium]